MSVLAAVERQAPAIRHGLALARERIAAAPSATAAEDWAWLSAETESTCARCGTELQRWETMNRQVHCTPCDELLHRPQLSDAELAEREREERLAQCGVPPAYLGYAASAWKGSLPPEFAKWCNEPTGIWYIHGGPGRGKTLLAVAALERARLTRKAGSWCLFADSMETLRNMRRAFPDGDRAVEPLRKATLLVLDDLGAERGTEFNGAALAEVIRFRHAQNLPTIVTSNLSPEELQREDAMAAVASRATTQLVTHLGGRDRRRAAS